ncbi:uncharacterized protein STEHIDRAFT_162983 [Stereum hirsutum FP-91666 SS1]|uniref:Uncharacterized protein n=1 Tax=Stereum hirsutum (strain FP-91666) TaxID=721885 RepID=R7S0M3_STEHR|nr:uncharacterized protein STEHIDRAFT_162983 [Stereum hirsutum FP-91666 SS1]EIM80097.1 hypothetical protein STEHIDRAFT_162983 [Stereum hirsutum FP-91666 SS1]
MISFTSNLFTLALAFAGASFASASALPRQVTSNQGTINAPTSGYLVSSNSSFPFSYSDRNWCEDGYSPVSVWLTDYEPTTTNLNATGQFPEGSYTRYFGLYTNPNFGLSPLSGSPAPPPSLSFPETDEATLDATPLWWLSVVETATNCPPGLHIPPQYGLTSVQLTSNNVEKSK